MSKGIVKYFNDYKGWGFISSEEPGPEVYVHYTAINMKGFKTLKEGQQVLYELAKSEKGLKARTVTPIN